MNLQKVKPQAILKVAKQETPKKTPSQLSSVIPNRKKAKRAKHHQTIAWPKP
jgi:hypothetical protein